MSYILDALKKSEREKTLGQVPTLETIVAGEATASARTSSWWLNVLFFILLLLAVLAGLYFSGLIKFGADNEARATARSLSATTLEKPQATASPALVQPVAQPAPAADQADSLQSVRQQPVEVNAGLPESLTAHQQIEAQTATPRQTDELAGQSTGVTGVADTDELALSQQQAQPLQQTIIDSDHSAPEPALHQDLKSVVVNVVSHSTDVRKRFVMVDLTIYKEGDRLPNGAQIMQIQRDGAIIEYQSKRYLLKP